MEATVSGAPGVFGSAALAVGVPGGRPVGRADGPEHAREHQPAGERDHRGPRAGVVAGWGLLGTRTFYAVVTSAAAGIFGTAFLQTVGVWPHPPSWAPFMLLAVALALALLLAVLPARRAPTCC